MNVASLYRKLKQILNDSNTALTNKGLNEVGSLNGALSEINKVEINRLPYLLRDEITEITEEDLEGCTTIGAYAFYQCKNLTSIAIPDSVTSIGDYAFGISGYYNNASNWEDDVLYIGKHLISIRYQNSNLGLYSIKPGTLVIADNTFDYSSGLKGIIIPDSVTHIGDMAFRGSSLESAIIGNGVINIGEYAFWRCTALKSVVIGGSITNIGKETFLGCTSLENITIPDSATNIGERAFSNCSSLTSITFPKSIESIGYGAFWGCGFTDVYFKSITPPILEDSITFDTFPTIHVPIGSGEAYKNATNWSLFADYIVEDIVVE